MSSYRRYNLPPPENAEHVVGEVFEFLPEHDRVKPPPVGTVELIPAGPEAEIWEFRPEDDMVTRQSIPNRELKDTAPLDQSQNGPNLSDKLNESSIAKRASFLLNFTGAMSQLSAEEFAVFDLIIMGGRSFKEASQELNIPWITAQERYRAAIKSIRRVITSDPNTRFLLEAMSELYKRSFEKST